MPEELETNTIHTGDCFDVLADLPRASVHAVVTDPPYGLAFMGRDWDDFEPREYQQWCEDWAREVKRVLKPGGHLLAFSGNRTHHRLFTGVEDAGFEIRDTLTWHYGSGFPKATDVSKVIDKRADAEREVVGTIDNQIPQTSERDSGGVDHSKGNSQDKYGGECEITEPATDDAKKWDGWKTGLKPATEYVVMARKPFDGATVDCVLEHGTGALNVENCRINGKDSEWTREGPIDDIRGGSYIKDERRTIGDDETVTSGGEEGRYPANVVFDTTEAERLDRKNGETVSEGGREEKATGYGSGNFDGEDEVVGNNPGFGDSGGPSRYFYTSKASRSERTEDGSIDNDHPTVKPLDLAEWLVRLVTREGQIVLDPFAGSGTIPKAAKSLGRQFVGIERQAKYADIARVRCGLTPRDPAHVRGDDAQQGLEAFD